MDEVEHGTWFSKFGRLIFRHFPFWGQELIAEILKFNKKDFQESRVLTPQKGSKGLRGNFWIGICDVDFFLSVEAY